MYSTINYGDMGPWAYIGEDRGDSVAGLIVDGALKESGPKVIEGMDEMFAMNVKKFKELAVFTQRLKVADPSAGIRILRLRHMR